MPVFNLKSVQFWPGSKAAVQADIDVGNWLKRFCFRFSYLSQYISNIDHFYIGGVIRKAVTFLGDASF